MLESFTSVHSTSGINAVAMIEYKHDAFVSYSRKNELFASKLEQALESYKPPKRIKVPQRYLDICRDKNDYAAGEYYQNLNKHLSDSSKLIVVCSPEARNSEYVNDEIRRFVQLRGAEHIIPLLISGIPNNTARPSQRAEMAFPEALCEALEMPLAINYLGFNPKKDRLGKGPFLEEWHAILAGIYGLSRSEISERERKKRIRSRRVTLVLLAGVIVVLCLFLSYALYQKKLAQDQLHETQQRLFIANLGRAQREFEVGNVALGQELLETLYDQPQYRNLAWSFLWSHYHNELATFQGHRMGAVCLAFSPDGSMLATSGPNGVTSSALHEVILWNVRERRAIWTIPAIEGVVSLAFDADGHTVVTGDAFGRLHFWDTNSKRQSVALGSPVISAVPANRTTATISAASFAAFTPGGRTFSPTDTTFAETDSNGDVRVTDVASTRKLAILKKPTDLVEALKFSPDGRALAIVGRDEVKVWLQNSNRILPALKVRGTDSLAFSSDNKFLAAADLDATRVWDISTNSKIMEVHLESRVSAMGFSPNGQLIAACRNGEIKFLDATSGQVLKILNGHKGEITSVLFSPDGKLLATGSSDETVKLWDPIATSGPASIEWPSTYTGGLAVSNDGAVLAVGVGDHVEIWATSARQLVKAIPTHTGRVSAVSFSPKESILAVAGDDGLELWDIASTRLMMSLRAKMIRNSSLTFSPDGKVIAGCDEQAGHLWDVASGREIMKLKEDSSLVWKLAFSPNGRTVATLDTLGELKLWDPSSHSVTASLGEGGFSLAYSPDGEFLAVGMSDGTVEIFDVASKQRAASLKGRASSVPVGCIAFSPNGKLLAAAGVAEQVVTLWDLTLSQEVTVLGGNAKIINNLLFSPDSKFLIVKGDVLDLWCAVSDEDIRIQRTATLAPDGKTRIQLKTTTETDR